jgi:hypothetical protein
MSQAATYSLNEAMYLLSHGNRVVGVRKACSWPYGLDECEIVFEGENAQADHDKYLRTAVIPVVSRLPTLFTAITAVLEKGGEI